MNALKKKVQSIPLFQSREHFFYRLQQLLILILHLVLLKWIYYVLTNSGHLKMSHVLYHFLVMSAFGAFLIRGTAWWANRHYQKELKKHELGE